MKKSLITLLAIFMILTVFMTCSAVDIDPILLDKPSYLVHECNEDLFFEVLVDPVIDYMTCGRHAKDQFLIMTGEFLYLGEGTWHGLDKNSFELKHIRQDGTEEFFQLNYVMTVMAAMKNGWLTLSDSLPFATLIKLNLIFDVNTLDKKGWTLIFRPAERGGEAACEIEIPLRVQY